MGTLQGIILDVDGTLVDSNNAHARAWVESLSAKGITVPFEEVRSLIGMGGDKLLPTVTGIEKESPLGKQIGELRKEIFTTRYLPTIQPFPGVRDLLLRLRDQGLKVVVGSSAEKGELKELLKIAGVDDLIEEETSSSDVDNSKPDPDLVHAALDKLGMPADQVLMIGDTPYDLDAASQAGVGLIAVRSGGWDTQAFPEALAVYDDLAHLLAEFESSPLVVRTENTTE